MLKGIFSLSLAGAILCAASAGAIADKDQTVSNPNGCKVVERRGGEAPSGSLSSSVTAGNGQVSAHSTGGHGVTVHSGNGGVSSSVTTTGSGNGQTTVTTSDGNCIIYVDPGKKED
jgi:hypothetical protein